MQTAFPCTPVAPETLPTLEVSEPTRVIAVRHGETAWNAETRLQGQLDIPLNTRGLEQARRVARALLHDAPDHLYSSDLARARQTAEAIGEATGLAVQTDPGLRERCFGVLEGSTYAEVESRWPQEALRWRQRDGTWGPQGGETLCAFYDRSVAAFSALACRHPGQCVVVVAHGGVLDCLYRAASRIALDAPRTWELGNTGVNRLLFTGSGFTLIGWGDLHHLDDLVLDEIDGQAAGTTA